MGSNAATTKVIGIAPAVQHPPQTTPAACVPARRWGCGLAGIPESIRRARHWPREFLPPCEGEDDLESVVGELATNALQHTASGKPGGMFTMDISWWQAVGNSRQPPADFLRLVVGDQGGDTRPTLIRDADDERNRGLLLVDGLSARWGISGGRRGRWIWADIPWTARGGLPLAVPDDEPLARQELAALRRSLAKARVWFSPTMHAWCGWPDTSHVPPVAAPSPQALTALLLDEQPGTAGRTDRNDGH